MSSIRRARQLDHWRTALRRNYDLQLNQVECYSGPILDGANFALKRGINAVIGMNGTGKSSFIRGMYNCFVSQYSNRSRFSPLIDTSRFTFRVEIDGVASSIERQPADTAADSLPDITALIFDPCMLIPSIQNLLASQNNLHELIESFQPRELSAEELASANYLANANYTAISITNIEDEYKDFPLLPFFQIRTPYAAYDSRQMGLGELSLLYFHWLVNYASKLETKVLFLIEEPESFIPPISQVRLANVVASTAAETGTSVFISTHSEHILERIPRDHIHIMTRGGSVKKTIVASTDYEKMTVLGLSAPKLGVLFFEDLAAELLLRSLLRRSARAKPDSFYYHKSGSDSGVLQTCARLPKTLEGFALIGILDGNARIANEQQDLPPNILFLPSEFSPDELLVNYSQRLSISAYATALSVTEQELTTALDTSRGLNHHDYFYSLATCLGEQYVPVFNRTCDLWTSDMVNRQKVSDFLCALDAQLTEAIST